TLPGAEPVGAFLAARPGLEAPLRQEIARALGRFLARLHQAGVTHRDLHPDNLLVQWPAATGPRLALIDLDAGTLGPPLSWEEARANLVVLNRWFALRCDRADRLRFWRAYAGALPHPPTPSPKRGGGEEARDLERRTLESNLRF